MLNSNTRTPLTPPPPREARSQLENTTTHDTRRSIKAIDQRLFTPMSPIHTSIVSKVCGESKSPSVWILQSFCSRYSSSISRYCDTVDIDPYYTLKRSMVGRIKNFFHWMCNNYSVKKISSVETYWHQLSQLYIKWKGRRISPLTLKEIYNVNESAHIDASIHTSNRWNSLSTVHWPKNTGWTTAKPTSLSWMQWISWRCCVAIG